MTEKDSSNYILILNEQAVYKQAFQLLSVTKQEGDTLRLVSCADYIYSPFGKIENEAGLKLSLLKHAEVKIRAYDEQSDFYELGQGKNKLVLFFSDDTDGALSSSIVKGKIQDSSIVFNNGIHIGMNNVDFYKIFFESFPKKLQENYNVVEIESCVQGIKHVYMFEKKKLTSVEFECVGCADAFLRAADGLPPKPRRYYSTPIITDEEVVDTF
ncbi:MAG TPA: hypothetical protein VFF27_09365 [Bacteroidia bacterium]|nr:hypothetical protein [Bacteroidia bacterium]